jgi:glycogen debranching enzyme
MPVEIRVGPPVLTINRGSTVMVTDQRGEIDQTQPQGVFAEDTRFLSTYSLYINDRSWDLVTSAAVTYYAARLDLVNPAVLVPDGTGVIPAQTLALTIDRIIDEGVHENFSITNYSLHPVHFNLEIVLRSDFADIFEVKSGRIIRRGSMATRWNDARQELITIYRNRDFARSFRYRVAESKQAASYANGRIVFEIALQPRESWEACGHMSLEHGVRVRSADAACGRFTRRAPSPGAHVATLQPSLLDEVQNEWRSACAALNTANEHVYRAYTQAVEDMGALRLPEQLHKHNSFIPAAGVPWFVAPFGRDSLIVSLQNMMVHAPFAVAALEELAQYQATERDDWRDAQPGKILHELRRGELAHFHLIPHTPYYGTADATILYLIVLHQAWKWTGDLELVKRLLPTAERCLEWIDKYGDLDGDGFQEYKTFSTQGYENMGWKDAGEAVVYPDGSIVPQPKALCELQGYVYDAWLGMAELYDALGHPDRSAHLRERANALRTAFDQAFWLEDEGTYAFALDPRKNRVATVASNAGHCLWSGIALPERAGQVVRRLLREDMFSGWGVRTLSSDNPSYNPFSYQNGSVWPHDNGIIAMGFKRYGYADEANTVIRSVLDAARTFMGYRLPEVYSGMPRVPNSFPSQYIGANIPQAWAAGSIFHFVQTILGLRADAPRRTLFVDPTLPPWLPNCELVNIEVGETVLNLRFERSADGSSRAEVIEERGPAFRIVHQPWRDADAQLAPK